jgi:hypothetical protein
MYSKHDFTMTYTPGLNVTYDEDETKPAGMNCILCGYTLSSLQEIIASSYPLLPMYKSISLSNSLINSVCV